MKKRPRPLAICMHWGKSMIFLLLFLAISTLSGAQTHMMDTLGMYTVYPAVPGPSTPAPKGYEPFYISTIARHGARYLSKSSQYTEPYKMLRDAAAARLLTPQGEALFHDIQVLRTDAADQEGLLVPRGEEEHRGLARRMGERFPEIFRGKGKEVHAMSSDVLRVVTSMSCGLEELRSVYPDLRITRECGPRTQKEYYAKKGRKAADKAVSALHKELVERAEPARFMSAMFRDPGALSEKEAKKLLEGVWECASAARMNDRLGIDLAPYLAPEDVRGIWEVRNRYLYTAYGPSQAYGDKVLSDMCPFIRHFVDAADAAIAGNRVAADLRFAHDAQVIPVAALMGIEGCVTAPDETDLPRYWNARHVCPVAMNIQLVFYRNPRRDDILVKVLFNEREVHLVDVPSGQWPYYRWEDVRNSLVRKAEALEEMSGEVLRVAFVGDIQVPDRGALARARETVFRDLAARKDIDLAVFAGDLVMENTSLLQEVKQEFDALPFPVLAVPGNHDRDGGLQEKRSLDHWKAVFGYIDTTVVFRDVRFILLDDIRTGHERKGKDYVGGLTPAGKDWLQKALLRDEADMEILVTHIPLRGCSGADSLASILSGRPDLLLIDAHTHYINRGIWHGMTYLNPGAPYAMTWHPDPRAGLMNCGAPRGYVLAELRPGSGHAPLKLSFVSVNPDYPGQASATWDEAGGRLLVNVFAGMSGATVTADGKELLHVHEIAPVTKELLADPACGIPARRIASSHLWSTDPASGVVFKTGEEVEIRYTDPHLTFRETVRVR